ncbi:MAG: UDP-N-acetylmuramoyl-tripeptide--D-alanyl-D-alanine ligase [Oscillospiraceae bacterium]|nr:UDP-N-acetylmuramoyl-tripeptide--D-alanyl-D-alanine ligase [Oscillospiraceae bacterium]
MEGMTIKKAAAACGGRLTDPKAGDTPLGKVVIDSRAVEPGDLFVAYKGEHVDGHDYIAAAFDRGAACCLAKRLPEGEARPVLLVGDVQKALEQIAAAYRQSLTLPVVGITGSVGKTSAKEMIAAVLESRYRVLKTDKNLNNQIGVPMTVSRISPEHDVAVVEMGISGFGEMDTLARIVRPTIGVFTVIGHAHLEFLGDLDGVYRAKTEMLAHLLADGTVIVNGDDPKLHAMQCPQRLIRVGLGEDNQVRATDIVSRGHGIDCTIVAEGRAIPVSIPAFGKHMVYAALEGAAVGLAMGLSDEEIARGIAGFETVGRRAAVTEGDFLTLIDDSYNANPDSVKCGVDSLMSLPGRHVAVLGDMLEMGETERELHLDVGRYCAQKGVDAVYTCGRLGADIAAGAGEIARHFASAQELIDAIPALFGDGDVVLVKASRGMHFETIAEALKAWIASAEKKEA